MTVGGRPTYSKTRINLLAKSFGYSILDEIVIIDYDTDWSKLAERLESTKKLQYAPHEKYVVHHQDTEYFLGDVGFAIENFNRVIGSLDIDPCRFVILTNHRGSTHKWIKYCEHEQNQFTVIETPWTRLLRHEHDLAVVTVDSCKYRFCSIMGAGRPHRDKLAHWITSKNLQQTNLVVYHRDKLAHWITSKNLQQTNPVMYHRGSSSSFSSHTAKQSSHQKRNIHYLSTVPFTRINETWSNHSRFESECMTLANPQIPQYRAGQRFLAPWYRDVFFDLVAETVFDYPHAFISEKTVRPIINGRPFIVVGAAHTLQWLQEMGFKTFSLWWDESYDQAQDPNQRLAKIFSLVETICSWSEQQCREILQEMMPVLEHNQKIYKGLAF